MVLNTEDEALYVIEQECGYDFAKLMRVFIENLKEKADKVEKSINTDLTSYESSLEEYNSVCCDILDTAKRLKKYVMESKKLDRNYILGDLDYIIKEANSI